MSNRKNIKNYKNNKTNEIDLDLDLDLDIKLKEKNRSSKSSKISKDSIIQKSNNTKKINDNDCNCIGNGDNTCFINHHMTIEDCSCCAKPYVINKIGESFLNIKPSCCILLNPVYKLLYSTLYFAILNTQLDKLVLAAETDSTGTAYATLLNILKSLFDYTKYRFVIADASGITFFDSNHIATNDNSYTNYIMGALGPNQNSTISAMEAQLYSEGTGYEMKFEAPIFDYMSTGQCVAIVAIRLGCFRNSAGTAILSMAVPCPTIDNCNITPICECNDNVKKGCGSCQ